MSSETSTVRMGGPAVARAVASEGERSEPERDEARATADRGGAAPSSPDPEVMPRARRRTFTAEYKARILREADACTKPGELGALLRREGLYSSHLTKWRRDRAAGALRGLKPKKRGRKGPSPEAKRIGELERENRRLKEELGYRPRKSTREAFEVFLRAAGLGPIAEGETKR